MDRKTALTEYIKDEIMRNRNARLDPDQDLLNSGILDSLSILQLRGFIEEKFGIQVPDEDVVFENFSSINSLVDYLERHYS